MTPEERKEYNKQYYLNNREKILENYAKKVQCKCGKKLSKANYYDHLKTKLHKRRMELKKLEKINVDN